MRSVLISAPFSHAVVCFAFSRRTSVHSSSIVFPCSEKCSFTIIRVFPEAGRFLTVAFPVSSFSVILSITHHLFSFWIVEAVRRRLSASTGLAPLHGSHVAVPIACDVSSVQAVAVREYHYQTTQVMAKRSDKLSFMDAGRVSLALPEKGHGVPAHNGSLAV